MDVVDETAVVDCQSRARPHYAIPHTACGRSCPGLAWMTAAPPASVHDKAITDHPPSTIHPPSTNYQPTARVSTDHKSATFSRHRSTPDSKLQTQTPDANSRRKLQIQTPDYIPPHFGDGRAIAGSAPSHHAIMSATAPSHSRSSSAYEVREGLDVDWLLHSKKGTAPPSRHRLNTTARRSGEARADRRTDLPAHALHAQARQDVPNGQPPLKSPPGSTTTPSTHDISLPAPAHVAQSAQPNGTPSAGASNGTAHGAAYLSPTQRPDPPRKDSGEESRQDKRSPLGMPKKESRRASWITNLGHKLAGGSATSKSESPLSARSPKHEVSNPFDAKAGKPQERRISHDADEPPVVVPASPRRPSVLVAAGTETKVDSPGFLGALRRLSSGNVTSMGKGAGSGAACPRKIMNVDHHRERVTIPDLDLNQLKRVAFCVDVEIAGTSAHGDENHTAVDPVGALPRSHLASPTHAPDDQKDAKSAKYKEKGEGAALKNPQTATQEKELDGTPPGDVPADTQQESQPEATEFVAGGAEDASAPTTTRKKEKKKRSEAERKERKERKRRHAEQNGLVPLEITRDDDDDSDSTSSNPSPGTNTPKKPSDRPTTDPLRIYKRCCQLRETTALTAVKDQIVQPAATLAEAPGTVSLLDLSGVSMTVHDTATLGDWLAVVPVRKLILDDCRLSDESVRVILSGLLSCKTTAQARYNRKLTRHPSGTVAKEQMGFIEKLSLKNNPAITSAGWKHIAVFMHMSRSLIAMDLTGIPFPTATGALIARAIGERKGDKLQELILTNCGLTAGGVADVVGAAIQCHLRRLGLAANNLSTESLDHVVRYVTSGWCEGLDLGSNDLHDTGPFLTEALDANNPLFALSLSNCNLEPDDLNTILPRVTTLKNFKFIDLSRNRGLFHGSRTAVPLFRKYLPKLPALKRLHLADVDLQPEHVIALAEMFPNCPALCHINLLENEALAGAMNSTSAEEQEEAAAFLAALMTAVRVSQRIIAIEIEVPSADTSEVVRALAAQVVAYSLRNMERSALTDMGVDGAAPGVPDKHTPEVLLHLVGHMDGYPENHDNDEPAPDEDYVIASTGIAKALGVCLRNHGASRVGSRNISPAASGTSTPRPGRTGPADPPKDVGLELCEAARKIRLRLRPALVKEDRAGNADNYYRLSILDSTLQRMIQRFEDEYPDAKPAVATGDAAVASPPESPDISRVNSTSDGPPATSALHRDRDPDVALRLSRTSSNTSLAARALTSEEGRMHRFGQSMRRELLKPTGTDDFAHGTSVHDPPEAHHLSELRHKLEKLEGEEIRRRVEEWGADRVVKQLGLTVDELRLYRQEDPEGYQMFHESQLAADLNTGLTSL